MADKQKPMVLVCDDEKEIVESIAGTLEETGKYKVLKAFSGEEALKKIEEHNKGVFKKDKIKLVLMDIRMPDIDGIDTMTKIHDIDKDVRALMVTAYDEDNYWIDSVFLGYAIAYIIKPFKENQLLEKVEDYFRGKANVLKTQAMAEFINRKNESI
ncbi:MAG: response regulator [Candidatus Margulisbacteria bacterium]|nr:response regulator [Candidatus Margulisiibacteriota bacterium]